MTHVIHTGVFPMRRASITAPSMPGASATLPNVQITAAELGYARALLGLRTRRRTHHPGQ